MLFEYEVLLNELDSFNKGLIAYENCQVVTNYYQKYKYTEHLGMLIGDEGLVSSIIEAGAKFIEWLKAKISAIIKAIKNFLIKLINKFLVLFGFKPIGQTNTAGDVSASWSTISKEFRGIKLINSSIVVEVPYDVVKIQNVFKEGNAIYEVSQTHTPELGNEDSITTYLDRLKDTVEVIVDAVKKYDDGKPRTKGTVGTFRNVLSRLFTVVDHFVEEMIRTSTDLEKFKNRVTDSMTFDQVVELARKIECIDFKKPEDLDPKIGISDIMRLASAFIKANLTVASHAMTALRNICRYFPVGPQSAHTEEPIDNDFKRRLEGFYGGELKIKLIVITSLDPRSWLLDVDVDAGGNSGWCYCGTGLSGVRFVYVNYNFVLGYIKQYNGQLTKVAEKVIKIIAHECRHAFDSQNGKKFDGSEKEYKDRQEERRAFHAENSFTITDHDIRWIEGILKKIESGAYS